MRSVREWMAEIDQAKRREKDWRDEVTRLIEQYEAEKVYRSHYAILWSNTEVLQSSLYNSLPVPDVRRRFRDADPIGKEVSEALNRALSFGIDDPEFDSTCSAAVHDLALTGRGVMRVRYVPQFGDDDAMEFERAPIEHVQWDEFMRGCGKTWSELTWVGFTHRMSREELRKRFPGVTEDGRPIADMVALDDVDDSELSGVDEELRDSYKTGTVYEVWDKDTRTVLFLAGNVLPEPLQVIPDPLRLSGFFPVPEPTRMIDSSRNLTPIPHYRQYRTQAEELMRISARINRLVSVMRLRGIRDPRLSELETLFSADDTEWVAVQNQSVISELGGIDKAIWIMPVEKLVQVLDGLYVAFEKQRQHIFEVSGLADIMRGQSNPNETLGAQQLKSRWGSIRLQKSQKAVQRMIRDALRMQAEIIGNRFQPETIQAMIGMPVSPEALQVLRSPMMRQFRVDIETDSTISDATQADMTELGNVLNGLQQWIAGAVPAIQTGLMSPEAVKAVALAVTRRARLGTVVEDAIQGNGPQQGLPMQAAPEMPPQQAEVPPQQQMPVVEQQMPTSSQQMDQSGFERMTMEAAARMRQADEMMHGVQQAMHGAQQAIMEVEAMRQGVDTSTSILAASQEAQRQEISQMLAALTAAVARLGAPKRVQLERDSTGRPIGGTIQ